jgi:hypoxanthine phosphoribosyltransferase
MIVYTRQRLARRIKQLGTAISRDYSGQTVDVVILLEDSFLFAADLVREISRPLVCHFVRSETHDVRVGGYDRREISFSTPPKLRGRNVLVVGAVLNTGITQDYLLKRLEEWRPRSVRLVVLFDKADARKVDLKPEYTGFAAASNYLFGYGLSGEHGLFTNLPYVAVTQRSGKPGPRKGKGRRPVSKQTQG